MPEGVQHVKEHKSCQSNKMAHICLPLIWLTALCRIASTHLSLCCVVSFVPVFGDNHDRLHVLRAKIGRLSGKSKKEGRKFCFSLLCIVQAGIFAYVCRPSERTYRCGDFRKRISVNAVGAQPAPKRRGVKRRVIFCVKQGRSV